MIAVFRSTLHTVVAVSVLLGAQARAAFVLQENFAPRFDQEGIEVWDAVAASDGTFYVAGDFCSVDGVPRGRVARFMADGTLDSGFEAAPVQNGTVRGMALDASGRLVLVGTFTRVGGYDRAGIVRLTATGAVDTSFAPGAGFGASPGVYRVAVDGSGRLLVAGGISTYQGISRRFVVRVLQDGTLDPSFVAGLALTDMSATYSLAVQSDDKVLVGGSGSIASGGRGLWRLNTDGSVDTTFNPGGAGTTGWVWRLALQPTDGRILLAGTMTSYNGTAVSRLARLHADGTLDATFAPAVNGTLIYGMGVGADGRITVAGLFTSAGGTTRRSIARILSDGSLDAGFDPAGSAGFTGFSSAYALAAIPLADGSAIIGGTFTAYNNLERSGLLRCTSNGNVDPSFAPVLRAPGVVHVVRELADGRLLVGGQFGAVNGVDQPGLARLHADGTLDLTFAAPSGTGLALAGFPYTPTVRSLDVQSDGRILVAGTFQSYDGTARNGVLRLEADGALDTTFSPGTGASGVSTDLVRRVGDDIFVGGNITSFNGSTRSDLARLDPTGALDAEFDPAAGFFTQAVPNISEVHGLVALDNGSVLAAGEFSHYRNVAVGHILALDATAAPDTGFAAGAGFGGVTRPRVLALTRSGARILAAGEFTTYQSANAARLIALDQDGGADATFVTGTGFDGTVSAILPRPDGSVLVGGEFFGYDGASRRMLALLSQTGALSGELDLGSLEPIQFSASTPVPLGVRALAQTGDGALLVGGTWLEAGGFTGRGLLKLAGEVIAPPTIVVQPASVDVVSGSSGSFTVDAAGTGTLTYAWQRLPTGGTWTPLSEAAPYAGVTTPTLTIHPTTYAMHGDQFRCVVSNGNAPDPISSPATLTVRIAPVITPVADAVVAEEAPLAFSVLASDPGTPTQAITYSLGGPPAGATIQATTGAFSWTPLESQGPGNYTITIVATKSDGASATEAFSVTVQEVNAAPVLSAIGTRYVDGTGSLTFTAAANDSDQPAQNLSFSLDAGAPDWASIGQQTGLFSASPGTAVADGAYLVTVRVVDDATEALADAETFTIHVDRTAPRVATMSPLGESNAPVDQVILTFTEAIAPGTFAAEDVAVTGPAGVVPVLGVDRIDDRTARVRLSSTTSPGAYQLIVLPTLVDAAGNALDQDGDGVPGEVTEDRFTGVFTLLAPPDLAVDGVTIAGDGRPGQLVSVSWTLRNLGDSAVSAAGFTEVALSYDGSTTNLHHVLDDTFTGGVGAGAAIARSVSFAMPADGPTGLVYGVVTANRDRAVVESNYANNAARSGTTFQVPAQLDLAIAAAEVREDAGATAPVATVVRNGPAFSALTVSLASSDGSEVTVPTTVVIPVGQRSATFALSAVADGVLDGPQDVQISAVATGFPAVTASVRVVDVDTENLSLAVTDAVVLEGDVRTLVVGRSGSATEALTVSLRSSSIADLFVPATVTIPAGGASVEVVVSTPQDEVLELDRDVTVTAEAVGHDDAELTMTILDDDAPSLQVSLSTGVVGEGDGPAALYGTVTRSPILATPLVVSLSATPVGRVSIPAQVVIPASQGSVSFAVNPLDDGVAAGDRTVEIAAGVVMGGTEIARTRAVPLTILDDDGPRLALVLAQDVAEEGRDPAALGTVSRPGPEPTPLTVSLVSSMPDDASVPAQVTIAANETTQSFNLATPSRPGPTGSRTVVISASADGLGGSEDSVLVTDESKPDLVVTSIVAPLNGSADSFVQISYSVENRGTAAAVAPASRPWVDRVYLSAGGTLADAVLVGEMEFGDTLPASGGYERTLAVRLPATIGGYYVLVEANADLRIDELTRVNNQRLSEARVETGAPYGVTVAADIARGVVGDTVRFSGHATLAGSDQPAAGAIVHVHVIVRGMRRILSTVTDARGDYANTWTPLPGEGGHYTVGAAHPGVGEVPSQDEFDLLGVVAEPRVLVLDLAESISVAGVFTVTNLADLPLSGVAFSAIDTPAGVSVNITPPSGTLPGLASMAVAYSVAATAGSAGEGTFVLRLTSAEGVGYDLPVEYSVVGPAPILVAQATDLDLTMQVGVQRTVPITLRNIGGAASGRLSVFLPASDWLSVASTLPLPSLEAGAATTLDLQLNPPADLDLVPYVGTLVVDGAAAGADLVLPFRFLAVTEATGTLAVEVTDEYTFYTADAPRVAGASVTVRDPQTGGELAAAATDAQGVATIAGLASAYYEIEVRADGHGARRATVFVEPGTTTQTSIFIPYEAVRTSWTVEPTAVADSYRISIETSFEANVPKPVVVVNPAVIPLSDLVLSGQQKQVDLTFTNHGLISARNFVLTVPVVPGYEFEALTTRLESIAAQQSVTIPVIVRRASTSSALVRRGSAARPTAAGGDCAMGSYAFAFACAGVDQPGGGTIATSEGPACQSFRSGGIGAGELFLKAGFGPETKEKLPCDECLQKLGQSALKCALNLGAGVVTSAFPPATAACFILNVSSGCAIEFGVSGASPSGAYGCLFSGGLACAPGIGPVVTSVDCACSLLSACTNDAKTGDFCGLGNRAADATAYFVYVWNFPLDQPQSARSDGSIRAQGVDAAVLTLPIVESMRRLQAVMTYPFYVLGDLRWLQSKDTQAVDAILAFIGEVADDASEQGATITQAEAAALLAFPRPVDLPVEVVDGFVLRWNRSLQYWAQGIVDHDDVPEGYDPDFIAHDFVRKFAALRSEALWGALSRVPDQSPLITLLEEHGASMSELSALLLRPGYAAAKLSPPGAKAQARRPSPQAVPLATSDAGVCATVKLRLDQGVVMTRSGFKATLELVNGLASGALTAVNFELLILDERGVPANERFGLPAPTLRDISAVDGSGVVEAGDTGVAAWVLVPADEAAPAAETPYYVGGRLRYQQADQVVDIVLTPVEIRVRPDAALELVYFHQRDVVSDDPHTTEVEPAEPFALAVMIRNQGAGVATDLALASAHPEIVDNEKGLLVDFSIVGGEIIEGPPGAPTVRTIPASLIADCGDIQPGATTIVQWALTASLQGLFTDYRASFVHNDSLGDTRLSLIKSVEVHELIRVIDDGAGAPAFLVNDLADPRDLADTIHFADGSRSFVNVVETASTDGSPTSGDLVVELTAALPSGWSYLRVPDPAGGAFRLVRMQREDGRELVIGRDAWTTDRTFLGLGRRPLRENLLHVVDREGSATYMLTYAETSASDVTPPVSSMATLPPSSTSPFALSWTGDDDVGIANYDVYVSEDGGPAVLWRPATALHGALFSGAINRSYAFHTRARDYAGNLEDAPNLPDATTTVTAVNAAPSLSPVPDQSIIEGETLSLLLSASDPDAGTVFTFQLAGDRPPGLELDPGSGRLTWITSPALGGRASPIVVEVLDNGVPRLGASANFTVTVAESNQPPVIAPPALALARAGEPLEFSIVAGDADIPAQTLVYSLSGGRPPGMEIDPASGRISWTPSIDEIGSVHEVTVGVSDNGSPVLSATTSWIVSVLANPDLAKDTWAATYFTADQRADATISGEAADPNGNDRSNLLEYALGAPPVGAFDPATYLRTAVSVDPTSGAPHAQLIFRQRRNDPGLIYQAEVSADRATWAGDAAQVEEISRTPIDAEFDEVTVQDRTAAAPGAPRYFRLRVVRN